MAGGKSPVQWALTPIRKYAQFSGRAPRAEYWWYTLAVVVLAIIVSTVEQTLGMGPVAGPYAPLSLVFTLAFIIPGLAVTVRRLHDTNRSGWWILIAVIPYCIFGYVATSGGGMGSVGLVSIIALIGGIALLVFMALPGNTGDNRFGPDPYGADGEQVSA